MKSVGLAILLVSSLGWGLENGPVLKSTGIVPEQAVRNELIRFYKDHLLEVDLSHVSLTLHEILPQALMVRGFDKTALKLELIHNGFVMEAVHLYEPEIFTAEGAILSQLKASTRVRLPHQKGLDLDVDLLWHLGAERSAQLRYTLVRRPKGCRSLFEPEQVVFRTEARLNLADY